jgi:hypothetical protein
MDEQDLGLIRLVTRHFNDLQGLGTVLAASAQILFGVVWLSTHDVVIAVVAVVTLIAAGIPFGRRVQQYYADRFGRIDAGPLPRWIGLTSGLAVLFVMSDTLRGVGPALLMVAFAGIFARHLIDGWPYRNYYIVAVAAALIAAGVALRTTSSFDAIVQGVVIVSVAEIPCGFADHALLVRAMAAMKTRRADALDGLPDTEHADAI